MKPRTIAILVLLALLVGGGVYGYQRFAAAGADDSTNLQTVLVERGTLTATVSTAGTIAAPQSATLVWRTTGVVGAVHVAVGDTVRAGDVLMELDPASLDRTAIQAQADLIAAQQALGELLDGPTDQQLAEAQLAIVEAGQALDALLDGPSAQQLAEAQLAIVEAEQEITTAEYNLRSVQNPVSQALFDAIDEAQLAYDTAQANLQLANVGPEVTQVRTTENTMNLAFTQLQRMQLVYDDCLAITCGERDQIERQLTSALNSHQAALDAYLTAKLQYETTMANLRSALDEPQTALDSTQANLTAAQAGPDAAKVALYQAELEVIKADLLQARADLAELQAGPASEAVAVAQADLLQTRADFTELQAGPLPENIVVAQAQVAAAQATVDQARVAAPFDATVVGVYSRAGDSVSSNLEAIALADLSYLEVQVDISEVDINGMFIGQEAVLTMDAAPGQTFAGRVSDVAFLGLVNQGVVTFPVTVVVDDPDPAARPGMTAAVSIVTDRHEDVLMVPNRAIRVSGGQRTVIVLFEGQQISVPVTLGLIGDIMSEIIDSALREGDAVVLNLPTTTQGGGGGGFGGGFGGGGFGRP